MNPNSPPLTEQYTIHSPSLKQKLKSSLKLSSCFHVPHHEHYVPPEYGTPRLVQSNSSEMRSSMAGQDHIASDQHFKDRAKQFISSRLGGGPPRHQRRHSSVDFRYDAESYSLNFDNGEVHEGNDSIPYDIPPFRSFSSRLPASPPPTKSPPPSLPPEVHPRVSYL